MAAFEGPVVEVHLSNPNAREPWRHTSVVAPVADGTIAGFGGLGYELAILAIADRLAAKVGHVSVELPPIGYAGRPDAVRAALDGATLIVSTPSNLRWLTAFGGTLGWAVIGPDRFTIVTDTRYADRASAGAAAAGLSAEVVAGRTRAEVRDHLIAATAGFDGPVRAEAGHLSHATWLDLPPTSSSSPTTARSPDCGGSRIPGSWPASPTPPRSPMPR